MVQNKIDSSVPMGVFIKLILRTVPILKGCGGVGTKKGFVFERRGHEVFKLSLVLKKINCLIQ